jgi:hypothetical protein
MLDDFTADLETELRIREEVFDHNALNTFAAEMWPLAEVDVDRKIGDWANVFVQQLRQQVCLIFEKHTTSGWRVETTSGFECSFRSHELFFRIDLTDNLNVAYFFPVWKINSDKFLDARPGTIACIGVLLTIAIPAVQEDASWQSIVASAQQLHWRLVYRFDEVSGGSGNWNMALQPIGDGKLERRDLGLRNAISMTEFFGANDFTNQ